MVKNYAPKYLILFKTANGIHNNQYSYMQKKKKKASNSLILSSWNQQIFDKGKLKITTIYV